MKKLYLYILIPTILLAIVLGVLSFGNPQWHKRIFMWQAYTWPANMIHYQTVGGGGGSIPSLYFPPEKHTGEWRTWYSTGVLKSSKTLNNGIKDGVVREWYDNGKMKRQKHYKNGKEYGLSRRFYESGSLSEAVYFTEDTRNSKLKKEYSTIGKLIRIISFHETIFDVEGFDLIYDLKMEFDERSKHKSLLLKFDQAMKKIADK